MEKKGITVVEKNNEEDLKDEDEDENNITDLKEWRKENGRQREEEGKEKKQGSKEIN